MCRSSILGQSGLDTHRSLKRVWKLIIANRSRIEGKLKETPATKESNPYAEKEEQEERKRVHRDPVNTSRPSVFFSQSIQSSLVFFRRPCTLLSTNICISNAIGLEWPNTFVIFSILSWKKVLLLVNSLFLPITEIKCSAKLNWNTLRHLTRSLNYLTRILSQNQFSSTFHFIQINQLWINTLTHNRLDSVYQIVTIFTFLVIWYDTQYHCLLLSLQSLLTLYL